MPSPIYTAPPHGGEAADPVTLPSLMYRALQEHPNEKAFNQPRSGSWKAYSIQEFRTQSEETALGLLSLGLERGDKVAIFLDSDIYFCIADMGCLIAGLVDVPIYLTHQPTQLQYVMHHSEAKAIVVADMRRLRKVVPLLKETPGIEHVIVAELVQGVDSPELPKGVELLSLEALRERGRERLEKEENVVDGLLEQLDPDDLATIIYTSGTTGKPKGVMLSHGNISYNGLTAFNGLSDYEPGPDGEVVLSFLPLTHIFARAIHYGFLAHGTSVYFTEPEKLGDDLKKIRPTLFATVPRLLEKVYGRIQERTVNLTGIKKLIGTWALSLAQQYDMEQEPSALWKAQAMIADALVFKQWREALGGRVKYIISGGAALNKDLANFFGAADVTILEGYGLTETSPVIAFNRPGRNRPGTVGEPIAGTEVRIADDGEILARGPGVMKGYFKKPEKTDQMIDEEGWLHTGDIGEMSPDGFLRITDRKKDLFKLSTGKYVTPAPLENSLAKEGLVEQAVVVGAGQKFCGALIFPSEESLRSWARTEGLDADQPFEKLVGEQRVIAEFQRLVDHANRGLDHWSTIKRFALIPEEVTVESGLLTPTMKIRRPKVHEQYEQEIQQLFSSSDQRRKAGDSVIVS